MDQPTGTRSYGLGTALFAVFAYMAVASGVLAKQPIGLVAAAGAVLTVLAALVWGYVYQASTVQLLPDMMLVDSFGSLFLSTTAECQWHNVQDVDIRKAGLLASLFDYGTLYVQTAGTERNIKLTMIPNVEHWRDVIAAHAEEALPQSEAGAS